MTQRKLSQEELQVLRDISIRDLLGVRSGRKEVKIRCPFHDDNTPSCSLYIDNTFYCHACAVTGKGAIDFFIKQGNSMAKVIDELANQL